MISSWKKGGHVRPHVQRDPGNVLLQICELYKSIQGEGLLTGTESVFVRTSGCNLRCDFCDTPFSSWQPEGQPFSPEQIVSQCVDLDCSHVVLTGGEPMLQRDVVELSNRMAENGLHITIETAGTIDQTVQCDLMSISPKLSNSTPSRERAGDWSDRHEATRHQPQVIRELMRRYEYQLKFVIDTPGDCDEVVTYLKQFPEFDPQRVLLMPQGIDEQTLAGKHSWIETFCQEKGFQFCPRMHIVWFGNQRGT